MDSVMFNEYVISILRESGHMISSNPVYANHSSAEAIYIDSQKEVITNAYERKLLAKVEDISLLEVIKWKEVIEDLSPSVQIFSAVLDSAKSTRSENIAEAHFLLNQYWNCTYSIVFFKNANDFIISFAGLDCSHVLSDWFSIDKDRKDVVDKIDVSQISLETCKDYFYDFLFSVAREYYTYPISIEEASYDMMPNGYENFPISKAERKDLIWKNLMLYQTKYGDDYVEIMVEGYNADLQAPNISDEIDRISFELELGTDEATEQLVKINSDIDPDNFDLGDDVDDEMDELDPAIFADPSLMVKWLEKESISTVSKKSHKEILENGKAERREQERLERRHRERERLEIMRRRREQQEAKWRAQERLETEKSRKEWNELLVREQKYLQCERTMQEKTEYLQKLYVVLSNDLERRMTLHSKEQKSEVEVRKQMVTQFAEAMQATYLQRKVQSQEVLKQELRQCLQSHLQQKYLEAEHREQKRSEEECQEATNLECECVEDKSCKLEQLEQEMLQQLKISVSSKYGNLQSQKSIVDVKIKNLNKRIAETSIFRFLERKKLNLELEDLRNQKDEIVIALQHLEEDYQKQQRQIKVKFERESV